MNKKKYNVPEVCIWPAGQALMASESLPFSDETAAEEEQLSKPADMNWEDDWGWEKE